MFLPRPIVLTEKPIRTASDLMRVLDKYFLPKYEQTTSYGNLSFIKSEAFGILNSFFEEDRLLLSNPEALTYLVNSFLTSRLLIPKEVIEKVEVLPHVKPENWKVVDRFNPNC